MDHSIVEALRVHTRRMHAVMRQLKRTRARRASGLLPCTECKNLDEVLLDIPEPVRGKISIAPLPKNMDVNTNKKRREERVRWLLLSSDNRMMTCASLYTSSIAKAECFAITLAIKEQERREEPQTIIISDSQEAAWSQKKKRPVLEDGSRLAKIPTSLERRRHYENEDSDDDYPDEAIPIVACCILCLLIIMIILLSLISSLSVTDYTDDEDDSSTVTYKTDAASNFTLICVFEYITRDIWNKTDQCTDYVYIRAYYYAVNVNHEPLIFTKKTLTRRTHILYYDDPTYWYNLSMADFAVNYVQRLRYAHADWYLGMWGATFIRLIVADIVGLSTSNTTDEPNTVQFVGASPRFLWASPPNPIRGIYPGIRGMLDMLREFPNYKRLLNQDRICFSISSSINYARNLYRNIDFRMEMEDMDGSVLRYTRYRFTSIDNHTNQYPLDSDNFKYEFNDTTYTHFWSLRVGGNLKGFFAYDDASTIAHKMSELLKAYPVDRCVVFDDLGDDMWEANFKHDGRTISFKKYEMLHAVSSAMVKRYGRAFPSKYY
ncbi:hypothetical protein HPB52_009182 [Rhipicephalus sanguineus]|uniref:Uncharacterized protein n=1 Tax=Rhipicephalus sanguineus TaxID=34632 RepID=A0A9D4SS32_RHISA|nr:hypothetical protein HPB52_009182 [Rhipicephalus sanguineus]